MHKFTMSLRVYIQGGSGGGNLSVEESFDFEASDFLQICQVLGEFHRLAGEIKDRKAHVRSEGKER
jgi:hypothetical protein